MAADRTVCCRCRAGGLILGGRSRDRRQIVNGLLIKTGCPWACCLVRGLLSSLDWSQVHGSAYPARRNGRATRPSAGSVDSQTIKTQPKATPLVMMPAKRSKAANGICWWIRRVCFDRGLRLKAAGALGYVSYGLDGYQKLRVGGRPKKDAQNRLGSRCQTRRRL